MAKKIDGYDNVVMIRNKQSLGINNLKFIDSNGKYIDEESTKALRELLFDCTAEYEFDECNEILIYFDYEDIEKLIEKSNNCPCVSVFDLSNGDDFEAILNNVEAKYILCVIEGRPTAQMNEIVIMDYIDQGGRLAMGLNLFIPQNFRMTIFYEPTNKIFINPEIKSLQ